MAYAPITWENTAGKGLIAGSVSALNGFQDSLTGAREALSDTTADSRDQAMDEFRMDLLGSREQRDQSMHSMNMQKAEQVLAAGAVSAQKGRREVTDQERMDAMIKGMPQFIDEKTGRLNRPKFMAAGVAIGQDPKITRELADNQYQGSGNAGIDTIAEKKRQEAASRRSGSSGGLEGAISKLDPDVWFKLGKGGWSQVDVRSWAADQHQNGVSIPVIVDAIKAGTFEQYTGLPEADETTLNDKVDEFRALEAKRLGK